MRRDNVTLEVSNVSWLEGNGDPQQPVLTVAVEDVVAALHDRLHRDDGTIDAGEVDVTFRFQGNPEEATGVMAITDRLTGAFLLEVTTPGEDIIEFVSAVRRYAERTQGDARYRTLVRSDDETLVDLEKRTLLVYAEDGELLRQHSLIPSGVEI